MFPRFMMPVAVAGGAGVLFSLGIMFGVGLLAPSEKIQANGASKYAQLTQGAVDQVKRIEIDRALTPIYPASPSAAVATDAASTKETVTADNVAEPAVVPRVEAQEAEPKPETIKDAAMAAATPVAPAQQTQPQIASVPEPAPAIETTGTASRDSAEDARPAPVETAPVATPVSTRSANACNVQACSRAYRSFRESDCTYQPYQGPRQLCVSPSAAGPTRAAAPRQQRTRTSSRNSRPGDLEDVADEVRRITGGREVLYPPPSMRDSRMIAIDRW